MRRPDVAQGRMRARARRRKRVEHRASAVAPKANHGDRGGARAPLAERDDRSPGLGINSDVVADPGGQCVILGRERKEGPCWSE